jgi:hypothetical protein
MRSRETHNATASSMLDAFGNRIFFPLEVLQDDKVLSLVREVLKGIFISIGCDRDSACKIEQRISDTINQYSDLEEIERIIKRFLDSNGVNRLREKAIKTRTKSIASQIAPLVDGRIILDLVLCPSNSLT